MIIKNSNNLLRLLIRNSNNKNNASSKICTAVRLLNPLLQQQAQQQQAQHQQVIPYRNYSSTIPKKLDNNNSPWKDYPKAPADPILGLTLDYKADDYPNKVLVGVGAYRDDNGLPYVLPCVKEAEKILQNNPSSDYNEYAGIAGDTKFINLALKFAYGNDKICDEKLNNGLIDGVQTLSGTGGLRVFGELLSKFGHKEIYIPNPTWGNHKAIFTNSGLNVKQYRYYDNVNCSLDFNGMIEDIRSNIPDGSCILLHVCAHNPTGMDPTIDEWKILSNEIKKKKLLPFFDCAYQGFASGDAIKDATSLRMFVNDGHNLALVQSFSKNFGLYGQRVGTLSIVGNNNSTKEEISNVISQIKLIIRPMYSNPPKHGANIVTTILQDEKLTNDFIKQCYGMAERITNMRSKLRYELEENVGSTKDWSHITKQIGMFAYSGLTKEQVIQMKEKHHVYCTLDGRISMAGVTTKNVNYIANAIHDVTK